MGGSGSIVFCGKKGYQLIASKKYDGTGQFGFTLIREHPFSKGESEHKKNTWYEYLKIDGKICSFDLKVELDLKLFNRKFKTGTVIKLYSYQFPTGYSGFAQDLNQSFNEFLFEPVLPIFTVDNKERYPNNKVLQMDLFGLKRRLEEDKNYIDTFFSEVYTDAMFGEMKVTCYVFKAKVGDNDVKKTKRTYADLFQITKAASNSAAEAGSSSTAPSRMRRTMCLAARCVVTDRLATQSRNFVGRGGEVGDDVVDQADALCLGGIHDPGAVNSMRLVCAGPTASTSSLVSCSGSAEPELIRGLFGVHAAPRPLLARSCPSVGRSPSPRSISSWLRASIGRQSGRRRPGRNSARRARRTGSPGRSSPTIPTGRPSSPDAMATCVPSGTSTLLPLALSRTQDDKGRIRWTLFGGSEQGPAAPSGRVSSESRIRRSAAGFLRRLLAAAFGEPAESLADLRARLPHPPRRRRLVARGPWTTPCPPGRSRTDGRQDARSAS